MPFDASIWTNHWRNAAKAATALGGSSKGPSVEPPASPAEIRKIEAELGYSLPLSLREVLSEFSRAVTFYWHFPDKLDLPNPFRPIFSGQCEWKLDDLPLLDDMRRGWCKEVFPNPDTDRYDAVWHRKLPFLHVANGDFLAIDLAQGPDGPVVYLSHDGDDRHGGVLGRNFIDLLNRWCPLGCPGAESWQFEPFVGRDGIDPECQNALLWREKFFGGGFRGPKRWWWRW